MWGRRAHENALVQLVDEGDARQLVVPPRFTHAAAQTGAWASLGSNRRTLDMGAAGESFAR